METAQIILLGVGIFLLLVFILGLLSARALNKFEKRIDKRMHAINVILAQKYDLLILMAKIFKKYRVKLPTEFEEELSPSMDSNLKTLTLTERLTVKAYLMKTSQSIIYYAEQSEVIREDNDYLVLKRALVELDDNHRKVAALYNADAMGYNYWIHVWYLRPLSKLSKFKDKDLIV